MDIGKCGWAEGGKGCDDFGMGKLEGVVWGLYSRILSLVNKRDDTGGEERKA